MESGGVDYENPLGSIGRGRAALLLSHPKSHRSSENNKVNPKSDEFGARHQHISFTCERSHESKSSKFLVLQGGCSFLKNFFLFNRGNIYLTEVTILTRFKCTVQWH